MACYANGLLSFGFFYLFFLFIYCIIILFHFIFKILFIFLPLKMKLFYSLFILVIFMFTIKEAQNLPTAANTVVRKRYKMKLKKEKSKLRRNFHFIETVFLNLFAYLIFLSYVLKNVYGSCALTYSRKI